MNRRKRGKRKASEEESFTRDEENFIARERRRKREEKENEKKRREKIFSSPLCMHLHMGEGRREGEERGKMGKREGGRGASHRDKNFQS